MIFIALCSRSQNLHCKFSTVPESLELTPPLPATAVSCYAIPIAVDRTTFSAAV